VHEASLINALIRKIENIAAAHGAKAVTLARVRLGALCHMSTDHFREHFAHAAGGTIAENAELEIEASSDVDAPDAQDIVLESVEIDQ
jgi:hydrogenase nickel incorporation protein HypA/HybF